MRKRLASTTNNADRIGAEAELQEMERQIAKGAKPEVQGGQRGRDSLTSEVKARTEPFLSEKNVQNHFNTTIKKASEQFGGQGSTGEAVINLGKEASILAVQRGWTFAFRCRRQPGKLGKLGTLSWLTQLSEISGSHFRKPPRLTSALYC